MWLLLQEKGQRSPCECASQKFQFIKGGECGLVSRVFASHAQSPGLHPQKPGKPGVMTHTCNPSTWKVEAGEPRFPNPPQSAKESRVRVYSV